MPNSWAPGSSPLWGAGDLERDNEDCTGFFVHATTAVPLVRGKNTGFTRSKTFNWDSMSEMRVPTTQSLCTSGQPTSPGGTRAALRSDAAQSRRLLKATTKNERKRQRRQDQATPPRGRPDSWYSLSGKAADCLTHAPCLSRHFPVMRRSVKLLCPVTPKVWPCMEQNFGSLDASPPVPPHWRRHGKMLGAEQVHVE